MRSLIRHANSDAPPLCRRVLLGARMVVAALLCALVACSGSSPSAEVKPGDRDYPTPNPHPTEIVQVTALTPPTLKVAFEYGYSASPRAGGLMGTGTECQRTIGLAVTAPFYVNIPVRMVAQGSLYSGNVEVDKFEPGRCEWTFSGISYSTVSPLSYGGVLVRFKETERSHAVTLDIWCIMAGIDPKAPELCGGLHFLSAIRNLVSPEFVASIPQSERDDTEADIGPETTSIIVRFHDLNSLSTSQSGHN